MAVKSSLVKQIENSLRLECSICKERFWLTCKYTDHMATHKHFTLICNICNKGFFDQAHLDEHYLTHTGVINTYNCKKCPKKFLQKYQLEKHIESHKPLLKEPVAKKKKSVHINNVMEINSEDDFSVGEDDDDSNLNSDVFDNDDDSLSDEEEDTDFSDFDDYNPANKIAKTRSGRIVRAKKLFDEEPEAKRKPRKSKIILAEESVALKNNQSNEPVVTGNIHKTLRRYGIKKPYVLVEKIPHSTLEKYMKKRNIYTSDKPNSDNKQLQSHTSIVSTDMNKNTKSTSLSCSNTQHLEKIKSISIEKPNKSIIDTHANSFSAKTSNIPDNISSSSKSVQNKFSHVNTPLPVAHIKPLKEKHRSIVLSKRSIAHNKPNCSIHKTSTPATNEKAKGVIDNENFNNMSDSSKPVQNEFSGINSPLPSGHIKPLSKAAYSAKHKRKNSNITHPSSKSVQKKCLSMNTTLPAGHAMPLNETTKDIAGNKIVSNIEKTSVSSQSVQDDILSINTSSHTGHIKPITGNIASNKTISNDKILTSSQSAQNNISSRGSSLPVNKILTSSQSVQNNISSRGSSLPVGHVKPYAKKQSEKAKNTISPSTTSSTPRNYISHSAGNKQFLYIGKNPNINKIKQIIDKVSNISSEGKYGANFSEKMHEIGSQNTISSNSQNFNPNIKNSTLAATKVSPNFVGTVPIESHQMGSKNVLNINSGSYSKKSNIETPSEEGILEKVVIQDFVVVRVTPEYMEKMQREKQEFLNTPTTQYSQLSNKSGSQVKNTDVSCTSSCSNNSTTASPLKERNAKQLHKDQVSLNCQPIAGDVNTTASIKTYEKKFRDNQQLKTSVTDSQSITEDDNVDVNNGKKMETPKNKSLDSGQLEMQFTDCEPVIIDNASSGFNKSEKMKVLENKCKDNEQQKIKVTDCQSLTSDDNVSLDINKGKKVETLNKILDSDQLEMRTDFEPLIIDDTASFDVNNCRENEQQKIKVANVQPLTNDDNASLDINKGMKLKTHKSLDSDKLEMQFTDFEPLVIDDNPPSNVNKSEKMKILENKCKDNEQQKIQIADCHPLTSNGHTSLYKGEKIKPYENKYKDNEPQKAQVAEIQPLTSDNNAPLDINKGEKIKAFKNKCIKNKQQTIPFADGQHLTIDNNTSLDVSKSGKIQTHKNKCKGQQKNLVAEQQSLTSDNNTLFDANKSEKLKVNENKYKDNEQQKTQVTVIQSLTNDNKSFDVNKDKKIKTPGKECKDKKQEKYLVADQQPLNSDDNTLFDSNKKEKLNISENKCNDNQQVKTFICNKKDEKQITSKNDTEKLSAINAKLLERYKAKVLEKERKKKEKYDFKKKLRYLEKYLFKEDKKGSKIAKKDNDKEKLPCQKFSFTDIIKLSEKWPVERKNKIGESNITKSNKRSSPKKLSDKDSGMSAISKNVSTSCSSNSKDPPLKDFTPTSNEVVTIDSKVNSKDVDNSSAIETVRGLCLKFNKNLSVEEYLKLLDEIDNLVTKFNIGDKCPFLSPVLRFCHLFVDSYEVKERAISLGTKIKNVSNCVPSCCFCK